MSFGTVAGYNIRKMLGEGGFGKVFLCDNPDNPDEPLTVKFS